MAHKTPYRVDGEVGRFTFTTHGVGKVGASPLRYQTGRWFFPSLQARQWYQTRGFKELALMHGVVEGSYRKTGALINRIRHQGEDGTPARRLCDTAEKEGQEILSYMERRADQILSQHEFTDKGTPCELMVRISGSQSDKLLEESVQEAFSSCDLAPQLKAEMAENPVPYEAPQSQVYVTLDDVGVKQQKAHRQPVGKDHLQKGKKQHTYTTVAHVENDGFSYVLAGKGVVNLLRLLLALILNNSLWNEGLIFLTDGQKTLQAAILRAFSFWGSLQLILDWYHLEKKCKEDLSRALNGPQTRNAILGKLCHLLWHGLTDRAIQVLEQLDPQQVKNEDARDHLIASLQRCRPFIPCYVIRKRLGLRNGSSIGEKMNDLLVADRQKHNGMSWSPEGSVALAALTAAIRNRQLGSWFKMGILDLTLKQAA